MVKYYLIKISRIKVRARFICIWLAENSFICILLITFV